MSISFFIITRKLVEMPHKIYLEIFIFHLICLIQYLIIFNDLILQKHSNLFSLSRIFLKFSKNYLKMIYLDLHYYPFSFLELKH